MNRKQIKKQPYTAPQCKVILTEAESFICNSVRPNAGGSTVQPGYDDKGEHDAGSIYFGDKSTIAPAKQGQIWDNDDEDEY